MVERFVYVLIALALAGLAWLSAGWTQAHHADLMRFGGPGHWLQWSALVSGTLLVAAFLLAAAAGIACLFFLFIAWALESPADSLNDPQWRELLFRDHPKRRLREWARSMRYFRFIRGPGGGMNDYGDRLAVVLKASSQQDIERILATLAAPGGRAPGSASHGGVRVSGARVDIRESGRNLELAITDSEQVGEVTQAVVDAARSVEAILAPLADKLIDPPQDDKYCVCPKYYPSFWQDEGAGSPTVPAPDDHAWSERARNQAFLMVCIGAALMFLAAMAWRALADVETATAGASNLVFTYLHGIGGASLAIGVFLVPGVFFLSHARHIARELMREQRRRRNPRE